MDHGRVAADPEAARRGGGGTRRADRDRRHGVPLPGRRVLPGGPVASRRRGARRDQRVPRRPGVGHRRALRPGTGNARQDVHAGRRFRLGRDGIRRRVLRDLPPGGPGDGPAAPAAAGNLLARLRTLRHRPRTAARHPHRGLRRRGRADLHRPRRPTRTGGLPDDRPARQCRLRPDLLLLRTGGPGRHHRHRLLLLPGRLAPRRPVAAERRVDAGPGRRLVGRRSPRWVRGLRPAAWPRRQRQVQVVLRRGRWDGLGRRRRTAGPGAAVGRPEPRAPGAGRGARKRGQPGRRLQRADRPPRTLPGTSDPRRPGGRRTDHVRSGRGRSTRHRHQAGRPDRGAGAHLHIRAGPARRASAVAGVAEVQHRAHGRGRRRRRRDQDGRGDPARRAAPHPARGGAHPVRELGRGRGRTADRGPGLARDGTTAPRGDLVVRRVRHQRPRDHRAGSRAGRAPVRPRRRYGPGGAAGVERGR